jgi:hypothetical protein
VLACLCGTSLVDIAKEVGVGIGVGLAQTAATGLSTKALRRLNHHASAAFLRKAVGGVSLARLAPLIGGVIAGAADGAVTRGYGTAAKRLFEPMLPA